MRRPCHPLLRAVLPRAHRASGWLRVDRVAWAGLVIIALSMALSPAGHRAAPQLPDWALSEVCGESAPEGALPAPCLFCLLVAGFVVAPAQGRVRRTPVPRLVALRPAGPAIPPVRLRAFARPPPRGPPAKALTQLPFKTGALPTGCAGPIQLTGTTS